MNSEIKDIGARIKGLRETEECSAESLAKYLQISVQQYIKYENGETDIPVGDLIQISNKFGVELTSLLTGEEPKLHSYCVVRKDKSPTIKRRTEYKYFDLSYNFADKKVETFLVVVEPNKKNDDVHFYSHDGQEFNYMLEGSMKLYFDDKEIELNQGDSIYFDSRHKHAMTPMNNQTVKFLAVIIH